MTWGFFSWTFVSEGAYLAAPPLQEPFDSIPLNIPLFIQYTEEIDAIALLLAGLNPIYIHIGVARRELWH